MGSIKNVAELLEYVGQTMSTVRSDLDVREARSDLDAKLLALRMRGPNDQLWNTSECMLNACREAALKHPGEVTEFVQQLFRYWTTMGQLLTFLTKGVNVHPSSEDCNLSPMNILSSRTLVREDVMDQDPYPSAIPAIGEHTVAKLANLGMNIQESWSSDPKKYWRHFYGTIAVPTRSNEPRWKNAVPKPQTGAIVVYHSHVDQSIASDGERRNSLVGFASWEMEGKPGRAEGRKVETHHNGWSDATLRVLWQQRLSLQRLGFQGSQRVAPSVDDFDAGIGLTFALAQLACEHNAPLQLPQRSV